METGLMIVATGIALIVIATICAMAIVATWFASRNFYNAKATVKVIEVQKEMHEVAKQEFKEAVDNVKPMDEVYSQLEAEAVRSPYDMFD